MNDINNNNNKRSLIIDANNLLYRSFFAQIDNKEDIILGMAHHTALWTTLKYYKRYPPDEIVMAFDSFSWRKAYTSDLSKCVTFKKYKGQRRRNLTQSQKNKLNKFDEHINEFAEIIRNQTSILVLKAKYLEADDLIAGYILNNPDTHHVVISSDKDYIQLMSNPKVTIIDPDSGKPRSLKEWNNDANLFLFEKCLRGDASDNIMSAYPRLRSKKIMEAYNDEFVRQNIMNHKFKVLVTQNGDIIEKEFCTIDVFEENNFLINLNAQPDYIKELIDSTILSAKNNRGKFNYFKFIKFCGKYELKNILNSLDEFIPMLSCKKIKNTS